VAAAGKHVEHRARCGRGRLPGELRWYDDVVLSRGDQERDLYVGQSVTQVEAGQRLAGQGIGLGVRVRSDSSSRLTVAGSRSTNPRANQRCAEGATITGVPARRTRAARSCHASGSPTRAALAMQLT
jgi:hypothetical protein